jgi:DNA-binding MarR family transcriptional regulator
MNYSCNNNFQMDPKKSEMGQAAFLLAQVGAHAASQFAGRLSVLELAPADAGILRLLRINAGISQQELAGRLRIHPSRLVAILDNLEKRSLIERRANPEDRRLYSLHLTGTGTEMLEQIGQVARQHQQALCSALTAEEREQLTQLLQKLAADQGLTPGVHPGYQTLGHSPAKEARRPRGRPRRLTMPIV